MNNLLKILTLCLVIISFSCGNSKTDSVSTEPVVTEPPKDAEPLWRKIKRAGTMNGNRFFTDEKGIKLFEGAVFYNAHEFKNGYCVVSQMGDDGKEKRGVIDENGKVLVPCVNDFFIRDFENGFFEIANPKIGYMDAGGKIIILMEYTKSKGFSKGLVKLEKNYKKWGILNEKGETILAFDYDAIGPWKQELSAVKKGKKWGFIDITGAEKIPFEYDFAYGFEHGISLVQKGKNYGFINLKNELIIDFEYTNYKEVVDVSKDEISETGYSESNKRLVMEEGFMILEKNGKWGYMDTLGKIIIPFEYEYIGVPSKSGIVNLEKNGKRGRFDLNTKSLTMNP